MTESASTPNCNKPQKPVTKEALHAARSELLDAFADAEAAVAELETKLDLKPNNASLGQKIGRLRKSPKAEQIAALPALLDRLFVFNAVRAEVVHRAMQVVPLKRGPHALFIERAEGNLPPPSARIVSLQQFRDMAVELRRLAVEIRKL